MPDAPTTVRLAEAFDAVDDHWTPRLAAECNDQAVKVATVEGEFVWHAHPDADECFLVVEGDLRIDLRDRDPLRLGEGDLAVVPAGVEHRPVALDETDLLLFEPRGTQNTGDAEADETVAEVDRV